MTKRAPKSLTFARGVRGALLGRDVERRGELGRLAKADRPSRGRNDLLPPIAFAHHDPSDLREPARNVRIVRQSHVKAVMNAVMELGFRNPVLVDQYGVIIDGVVRVRAAKALGLTEIPCIVVDITTDEERRLCRLASNRLGENGEWNAEALAIEFKELILADATLEITGFADFEIEGLITETVPVTEPGPLGRKTGDAVARQGDLFRLGPHRVLCGNARDGAALTRLMAGEKARFLCTDVPFNVEVKGHVTKGAHREFAEASGEMSDEEFLAFNEEWITTGTAHIVEGGILATFIDWRGLMSVSAAALMTGLTQLNLVVWTKTNGGMGSLYRSQHELLPMFKKGTAPHVNNVELGKKGRWRSNVWSYPGASSVGSDARKGLQSHPTVKPVAMLADVIRDLTHAEEIVLDPFLGSGSTLIAAEETGRICYGSELDPLYVDVIMRRFKVVTGRDPILEETGETFEALADRRAAERSEEAARSLAVVPRVASKPRPRPARKAA